MTTKAERRELGKRLRESCPRTAHGDWNPRSADPVTLLEESDQGRIEGLIPVRYGRMSRSRFVFFRGSAIIQARDLASAPSSGIDVQLCGDAHLMNFRGFATPERNLVFDINDFDETFPGPFEWDVKRLAVSLILAARDRNFAEAVGEQAVRAAVATYRERMIELAGKTVLERWYGGIRFEDLLEKFGGSRRATRVIEKIQRRAAKRTSESLLPKLTTIVDGHAKIVDDPPLISHFHKDVLGWEKRVDDVIERYRTSAPNDVRQLFDRYELEDTAMKVVGVGSVGTHCYVAFFLADGVEPLFLQIKQARRSVLEPGRGKSRFTHQGLRVVVGQRLMQTAGDIFLGWTHVPGERDYYVRQLRDMKVTADVAAFVPASLVRFATACGWALARAHAKAGDADMVAGYLGTGAVFDIAVTRYAKAYADQVEHDFKALEDAIRSGRLPVELEALG